MHFPSTHHLIHALLLYLPSSESLLRLHRSNFKLQTSASAPQSSILPSFQAGKPDALGLLSLLCPPHAMTSQIQAILLPICWLLFTSTTTILPPYLSTSALDYCEDSRPASSRLDLCLSLSKFHETWFWTEHSDVSKCPPSHVRTHRSAKRLSQSQHLTSSQQTPSGTEQLCPNGCQLCVHSLGFPPSRSAHACLLLENYPDPAGTTSAVDTAPARGLTTLQRPPKEVSN